MTPADLSVLSQGEKTKYGVANQMRNKNLSEVREGADKSLARPTSRCRRKESIVSLEIGVYSCAELQAFSCYRS